MLYLESSTRPAPLMDGSAREGGLSPDAAFSTHRTSVTFQDEQTDTVGGKVKVGGEEVKVGEEKVKVGGEEVTGRLTADVLDEDDEEDELIEIRLQFILHSLYYTAYITQFILHSLYYTVYITQLILHSLYYTVYITQFILHSLYYTVYITQFILHSLYYTAYITQFILHSSSMLMLL